MMIGETMLTPDELAFVRERIAAYPSGIPSNAWGYGPFLADYAKSGHDYKLPGSIGWLTTYDCAEYG